MSYDLHAKHSVEPVRLTYTPFRSAFVPKLILAHSELTYRGVIGCQMTFNVSNLFSGHHIINETPTEVSMTLMAIFPMGHHAQNIQSTYLLVSHSFCIAYSYSSCTIIHALYLFMLYSMFYKYGTYFSGQLSNFHHFLLLFTYSSYSTLFSIFLILLQYFKN